MSPKSKVFLSAMALFLTGAVSGGFGSALVVQGQPSAGELGGGRTGAGFGNGKMAERIEQRLKKRLALSQDQQARIHEIFESSKGQIQEMFERQKGERRQVMQAAADKIRNILTSEQQREFDQMREKMHKKMERLQKGEPGQEPGGRRFGRRGDLTPE